MTNLKQEAAKAVSAGTSTASEERPAFHGSDLELVEAWYHIPREEIICYSDNINPLGLSPKLVEAIAQHVRVICRYPERNYETLRAAVSRYCGADIGHILVGSGATDLISRFIRETAPKKAVLISPSYSEYEREVALCGGELLLYPLHEKNAFRPDLAALTAMLDSSVDLLIFCNPNNPTGYAMHHEELRTIYRHCREHKIACLIDETYVEFTPDMDAVTSVPLTGEFDNIFVLRGISKFFSAPGLRFGYAVTANEDMIARMNHSKEPWSINSIAAECVPAMLSDTAYIEQTSRFIAEERTRLADLLEKAPGFSPYPTETNFMLVKLQKEGLTSADVFDALIRERMMIRDCASFDGLGQSHIRFNIRGREENDRMIQKLLSLA